MHFESRAAGHQLYNHVVVVKLKQYILFMNYSHVMSKQSIKSSLPDVLRFGYSAAENIDGKLVDFS